MTARIALLLFVANATTLVANAATLAPASVPAAGRQEVLLTLDAPAALQLSARSASGSSCELTDRVRGPFAQAGTPGSANCELDPAARMKAGAEHRVPLCDRAMKLLKELGPSSAALHQQPRNRR